ncbi:MAG: helix-turn-helix domain-containing protein [Sphingobacteriaceae bacterium]
MKIINSSTFEKLHKGTLIERLIRRNGVSISDLAKRMGVNRRSVYNWFDQRNLKLDTVIKIGNIVGCDIPKEYPEAFTPDECSMLLELDIYNKSNLNGSSSDEKLWMDKYVKLLEEYNQLLIRQSSSADMDDEEQQSQTLITNRNREYAYA